MSLSTDIQHEQDMDIKVSKYKFLGALLLFEQSKQDAKYIADAVRIIDNDIESSFLALKVRAGWAFANLCAILDINSNQMIDEAKRSRMLALSVQMTKDHEKCRVNGIRSFGYLVRTISETHARHYHVIFRQGIDSVLKNMTTGAFKTRWNSCFAVSNLLKNTHLNWLTHEMSMVIFNNCIKAVEKCKNYKVRIHALECLLAWYENMPSVMQTDEKSVLQVLQTIQSIVATFTNAQDSELKGYESQFAIEVIIIIPFTFLYETMTHFIFLQCHFINSQRS